MKVGWDFVTWSNRREVRCAVPACRRVILAGHARVDQKPGDPDFRALCVRCWAAIQFGMDPNGDPLPDWEKERRRAEEN